MPGDFGLQSRLTPPEPEISRIQGVFAERDRTITEAKYSLTQAANLFRHCHLLRSLLEALRISGNLPLSERSIADVGCGTGSWLLEFLQWGADGRRLYGIDLLEQRLMQARRRLPESNLEHGDAQYLPWPDESLDIVTQFVVFTSILDPAVKRRIAGEMLRTVKPAGAVIWYDFRFNNPRNPDVRGIRRSEIHRLFPGCTMRFWRVTLAPPLARLVVPVSWSFASLLEFIPQLRTHYLVLIQKRSNKTESL